MRNVRTCVLAICVSLTYGCVGDIDGPPVEELSATPLDQTFADASAEFDVPPALLTAIGYVESRWQMVEGTAEFDGPPHRHHGPARGSPTRGAALARSTTRTSATTPRQHPRRRRAAVGYADDAGIDRIARRRGARWSRATAVSTTPTPATTTSSTRSTRPSTWRRGVGRGRRVLVTLDARR